MRYLLRLICALALGVLLVVGCGEGGGEGGSGGMAGTGGSGGTERIVLDFLAVAVNIGGSQEIRITTENGEASPNVTVVSQDPSIASVAKSGSSFTVTGESAGSTRIEVRDGAAETVLREMPTTVYDPTVLDVGDMFIKIVDEFDWRWSDRYVVSGSPKDVSLHHPIAPPGFFPLGSIAVPYHAAVDPNGINGQFAVIVVKRDPRDEVGDPAIAPPDGFELVVNIGNIGWGLGGSIWKPIAPPGYRCMGLVAMEGFDVKPDVDDVRCVREDLTFPTDQSTSTWSGNDPSLPFSWRMEILTPTLPATDENDVGQIASGSFQLIDYIGGATPGIPVGEALVLRLKFPLIADAHSASWPSNTGDVLPHFLPNLTGQVVPQNPYAPPVLTKTMLVPLMAVNDPDPRYHLAWRVENSPFYQVERSVGYALVDCRTAGNEGFIVTFEAEVGSETEQVRTFTEETSWSITSSLGIKIKALNLGVSGTFSKTFGYSQSTGLSEFVKETVSQPVTVPANGIGCYWNAESVFTARRHTPDGPMTEVSNTGSILENGNVHVDSWP